MSKETPKYHHKFLSEKLKDSFVEKVDEQIHEDKKGIRIKFFSIDKKNRKKISIISTKDGFSIMTDINGKKTDKSLTKNELLALVAKDEDLKFVEKFLKTLTGELG